MEIEEIVVHIKATAIKFWLNVESSTAQHAAICGQFNAIACENEVESETMLLLSANDYFTTYTRQKLQGFHAFDFQYEFKY